MIVTVGNYYLNSALILNHWTVNYGGTHVCQGNRREIS